MWIGTKVRGMWMDKKAKEDGVKTNKGYLDKQVKDMWINK